MSGMASCAIDGAELIVGGQRHLDEFGLDGLAIGGDIGAVFDAIAAVEGNVCVLASGDPGFFGIVRPLAERFGADMLEVHPAPSSVALAFARLGIPWDDALVVSAHGRDPRAAINAALRHPKVAILTEPRAPAESIVAALEGRDVIVAEALGTPAERLHRDPPFAEPNVVIVLGEAGGRATLWPPRTPDRWALPESAFEHRAGMITKAEVRA